MIGSKIVFNVSRFKPAPKRNRFLADLRHGSNSVNSDSGLRYLYPGLRFVYQGLRYQHPGLRSVYPGLKYL